MGEVGRSALLSPEAVARIIWRALKQDRGFSFVRLGDSEGAVLGYDPETATAKDERYLQTLFGANIGSSHILELASLLRGALLSADLIGIRDDVWLADPAAEALTGEEPDFHERFRSALKLRDVEKGIDDHALRRLFGMHKWAVEECRTDVPMCSAWIAYDLGLLRFWERAILSRRSLLLINCSPSLPKTLSGMFGADVDFVRIPDMERTRHWWSDDDRSENVYPDSYDRVAQAIDVPQNGRLCIIGAGVPGKAYAAIIKRQGGIALDLGGLLDAWDNRLTRPLVYATKNKQDANHLPFMLVGSQQQSKIARLIKALIGGK